MSEEVNTYSIFKKPSLLLILFCVFFSVFTMDLWRPWHTGHVKESKHTPFTQDVAQYYSYLPALLMPNYSMQFNDNARLYLLELENKERMPKTTYGMAILYSPFFALGYKIAINENKPLDGFCDPFATTLHWGSIFYGLLGLLFLRNFLVKFYSETTTLFTLVIVFFGTNLMYYILGQSEMTHGYLFMLNSALLLTTYHWYQKITFLKSLLIGILLGIIALIRPTEALVALLFVFWMVGSKEDLKSRINLFLKNYLHILIILIIVVGLWIPQFLFWHSRTGNYLFYSYPGENFFWNDPQIKNILFSYRKGWFVYTPIMVIAFLGLFFMRGEIKKLKWIITAIALFNIYMLSCWWDWFFGGSFGARGFVQHYAFLSIPMASFVSFICHTNIRNKITATLQLIIVSLIFCCISLNIGQTYQYSQDMIHYNGMNKKLYRFVFGNYKYNEEEYGRYWSLVKEPDYEKLKSGEKRNQ